MKNHVATLMSDFYKQTHAEQYPKDMKFLTSYFTPRMSRLKDENSLICWGVQGFIKEFLIEYFNDTFFNISEQEVMREHERTLKYTMTKDGVDFEKIRDLHKLGYLPIEIQAIPEGTRVPIHVPMIMIRNTHPDFMWVTNFIESVMSCELWYPMTVANQAYRYRQIANKWFNLTQGETDSVKHAISEFGFRGGKGREAGILASAAFLTSFDKTATIPAILYLEDYYDCDLSDGTVGSGMISTEHSVMCSNTAISDGNEEIFIKKLLTEIYPNGNFSMVCDSYDYWNVVENILCKNLKQDILNRDGCLFVRGDSGKPADIICGTLRGTNYLVVDGLEDDETAIKWYFTHKAEREYKYNNVSETIYRVRIGDKLYKVKCEHCFEEDNEGHWGFTNRVDDTTIKKEVITPEMKGTAELLWDAFGGTVNEQGYKVLDKHVRVIYGDSITPELANEIYKRLADKGFAASNVALGAGSFSMQCTLENGVIQPFTRDTYGIAIKATYGEMADGKPVHIFKNPKTDTGNFKKSQCGMCYVYLDEEDNTIKFKDGFNRDNLPNLEGNLLRTVFKDGKQYNVESIHTIRNRLHNGKF